MVQVTAALKQRMLEAGVSTLHHPPFGLPADCTFEPPCSIKWMAIAHSVKLGAFSYAVSGYFFNVEIRRYSSIGESVQIGRGSHPTSWGSTSPLFYQQHNHVFNFDCPAAATFKTNAPYVGMKRTLIGNDVYIGHGTFIMQGVNVGDGAVIGAGSVVTKDVPSYAVVAGSPAIVRKMRFDDATIKRMQALSWWQYAFWDLSGIPAADPTAFLDFIERKKEEGITPYRPSLITMSELESTQQQR